MTRGASPPLATCRVRKSIQELLLYRHVQRFRGRLVFQAHRLVHHSTLGLRVIKKRKKSQEPTSPDPVPDSFPGIRYPTFFCHSSKSDPGGQIGGKSFKGCLRRFPFIWEGYHQGRRCSSQPSLSLSARETLHKRPICPGIIEGADSRVRGRAVWVGAELRLYDGNSDSRMGTLNNIEVSHSPRCGDA